MKIHYRFHPQCGQVVTLVRKGASFGLHQVQVALPCGDQLLVPEWMLDEEFCREMEVVERPAFELASLLALRALIDAQERTAGPVAR